MKGSTFCHAAAAAAKLHTMYRPGSVCRAFKGVARSMAAAVRISQEWEFPMSCGTARHVRGETMPQFVRMAILQLEDIFHLVPAFAQVKPVPF